MSNCCVKGFKWDGQHKGRIEKTSSGGSTYVTGANPNAAILVVHDLFGWTFPNVRILADAYAEEAKATVYVPDFATIRHSAQEPVRMGTPRSSWLHIPHSKEIREPEIFAFAGEWREKYQHVGAIGFCYGGWAVFRLGARTSGGLMDCISTAHPSWLTKEEIEGVGVPVQILAPGIDLAFTPELKDLCNRVIPSLGLDYDFQHFPVLEHGFTVRGDRENEAELKGVVRAKNAAVYWFNQYLH